MRIVFLAVDDEFAGSMQRMVYAHHSSWIVGSVISTCSIYRKSPLGAFWFVLRQSGFRYGAEMFRMKVVKRLSGGGPTMTPSRLAKDHQVPIHYSADINAGRSLQQLRDWNPDIVVATNFSHYIGQAARKIAKRGTWNLHKSYLPHFRGMAPSFYALLHGSEQTGVTLHEIGKGIDTGDIIRQIPIAIVPGDTVYSLNQKTADVGGRLLSEIVETDSLDAVKSAPQPAGDWPYYTFPSPQDVRRFFDMGLRF